MRVKDRFYAQLALLGSNVVFLLENANYEWG